MIQENMDRQLNELTKTTYKQNAKFTIDTEILKKGTKQVFDLEYTMNKIRNASRASGATLAKQ